MVVTVFEVTTHKSNMADISKEIKQVSHKFDGQRSKYNSIDEVLRKYSLYRWEPEGSNNLHLKDYRSLVDSISHRGGSIFQEEVLVKQKKDIVTRNTTYYHIQLKYATFVTDVWKLYGQ